MSSQQTSRISPEISPEISIVVPLYQEAENISLLVGKILSVMRAMDRSFELILVDDGSQDGTFSKIRDLKQRGASEIIGILFRRNFGQTAAMKAGFDHARGAYVVSLDGDLQNDPKDIPRLIDHLEKRELDVVVGWRKTRKDPLVLRKIPSRIANALIGRVTGVRVHDYGCSLKAYRADVVKNIPLYGEMHRFIPALADLYGARIDELEVDHHPRHAGVSHYTLSRTFRVVIDLIGVYFLQRFSARPLHLLGLWGGLFFLSGVGVNLWLTAEKLFFDASLSDRPMLLFGTLLILVGIMLFGQGLILEMLSRTNFESQGKKSYTIRERL